MARRAKDMVALEAKHAPKPKAPPTPEVRAPIDAVLATKPSRPRRLTRQERAKVRQMLRDSREKHGRSRRDYLDVKGRNAAKMTADGINALVFYLQDEGAGAVSVRQLLDMKGSEGGF